MVGEKKNQKMGNTLRNAEIMNEASVSIKSFFEHSHSIHLHTSVSSFHHVVEDLNSYERIYSDLQKPKGFTLVLDKCFLIPD
jgi:hypothetical protein